MEGPSLKYRNDYKLHIYQGPGIKSWIIFSGLNVLGLSAAVYGFGSLTMQALCIACCHALGWAWIQEWQDCVIDRCENLATLTRCKWYDRLRCRVQTVNTRVFPLNTVVAVETRHHTLLLVLSSGIEVPVATETRPSHLDTLKQELSNFLRLSPIEELPPGFDHINYIFDMEDSYFSLAEETESEEPQPPVPLALDFSRIKILVEPPDS